VEISLLATATLATASVVPSCDHGATDAAEHGVAIVGLHLALLAQAAQMPEGPVRQEGQWLLSNTSLTRI
jgi:hypothetical protein